MVTPSNANFYSIESCPTGNCVNSQILQKKQPDEQIKADIKANMNIQ
jgi:hypothetical protein